MAELAKNAEINRLKGEIAFVKKRYDPSQSPSSIKNKMLYRSLSDLMFVGAEIIKGGEETSGKPLTGDNGDEAGSEINKLLAVIPGKMGYLTLGETRQYSDTRAGNIVIEGKPVAAATLKAHIERLIGTLRDLDVVMDKLGNQPLTPNQRTTLGAFPATLAHVKDWLTAVGEQRPGAWLSAPLIEKAQVQSRYIEATLEPLVTHKKIDAMLVFDQQLLESSRASVIAGQRGVHLSSAVRF